MRFRIDKENFEPLAKRFFYLLWTACRGPAGMGILQAMAQGKAGSDAEEETQVFTNIAGAGDYCVNMHSRPGELYADYAIGRMMKVGLKHSWAENEAEDGAWVEASDEPARPDYQAWAGTYPTALDALRVAAQQLSVELTEEATESA